MNKYIFVTWSREMSHLHHFLITAICFILIQTPLELDIWLQSYEGFDNAKNNMKFEQCFCQYLINNIPDIRLIPLDNVTFRDLQKILKEVEMFIVWDSNVTAKLISLCNQSTITDTHYGRRANLLRHTHQQIYFLPFSFVVLLLQFVSLYLHLVIFIVSTRLPHFPLCFAFQTNLSSFPSRYNFFSFFL